MKRGRGTNASAVPDRRAIAICGRGVGRRKRAYREPTAIVELGAAGECDFPKRQVRANGGGRIHSNQRLARNRGRRLDLVWQWSRGEYAP